MAEASPMVDPLLKRTLRLAVAVAAHLELPGKVVRGGHTVGEGYYYKLVGSDITAGEVKKIADKVKELVASDAAIGRVRKSWKEMCAYFQQHGLTAAKALLESRVTPDVKCYEVQGVLRLSLYPVYERMGQLKAAKISVIPFEKGFVAAFAEEYVPQPALLGSHADHLNFSQSMGVESVGALGALQQVGRGRKDYVLQCEFRQEGKLANIAHAVRKRAADGKPVKVICIAGPSSSGKTTFATKLCMYLQNAGFVARPLSVDNYYLPLDRQPRYQIRHERSDCDFDHIESMDVELVGKHMNAIVNGESVMTPVYNMVTGYWEKEWSPFPALPSNGILVIEGIHALNPFYTQAVDSSKLFKIFISPLTGLQLDDANTVQTTVHRLTRRLCRDYLFRGKSASRTMQMWDNVRKGEVVWIYPHQNNADFVMNSAAEYEIPVLKTFVEPLLRVVTPEDPNYDRALELLSLLDKFPSWPSSLVPPTALLREFIDDGVFDCH